MVWYQLEILDWGLSHSALEIVHIFARFWVPEWRIVHELLVTCWVLWVLRLNLGARSSFEYGGCRFCCVSLVVGKQTVIIRCRSPLYGYIDAVGGSWALVYDFRQLAVLTVKCLRLIGFAGGARRIFKLLPDALFYILQAYFLHGGEKHLHFADIAVVTGIISKNKRAMLTPYISESHALLGRILAIII